MRCGQTPRVEERSPTPPQCTRAYPADASMAPARAHQPDGIAAYMPITALEHHRKAFPRSPLRRLRRIPLQRFLGRISRDRRRRPLRDYVETSPTAYPAAYTGLLHRPRTEGLAMGRRHSAPSLSVRRTRTAARPRAMCSIASNDSVGAVGSTTSVLAVGSGLSVLSLGSWGSLLGVGSLWSIGSVGSALSIGSVGSLLSIGSVGSLLSIGAVGGYGCIGTRQVLPRKEMRAPGST